MTTGKLLQSPASEEPQVQPHSIEAEQALLGALMVNNEVLDKVADLVRSEDFHEPVHGRIFRAVMALQERGDCAAPHTLASYFENDEALAEIGGPSYLGRLAGSAVTIINTPSYARVIRDLALRRQMIVIGEEVARAAAEAGPAATLPEQIERIEQLLYGVAERASGHRGGRHIRQLGEELLDEIDAACRKGGVVGVPTGFADLDRLVGGLHRKDLTILAGRPSMGKTALATNIAYHAAQRDHPVAFFSLEMGGSQIAARVMGELAGISPHRMRTGNVSPDDFRLLDQQVRGLENVGLFVDDEANISLSAIRARARTLKRRHNIELIIADYLQLVRVGRAESRLQEVRQISAGLKGMAKELDIPVLALSQLSRAVEGREDKRPQLSDLRESGDLEQDADIVMFIYRPEYYLARTEPKKAGDEHAEWEASLAEIKGLAELIVAKHRNGPIGSVKLYFDRERIRFGNLARGEAA
jgi:replicative DNA helicase